jgi:large subunit ribosomal protein L6
MLTESFILAYQKLEIKGVGYRAFFDETQNQKLLTLKLGYSHLIYIRAIKNLSINCFTKTKLYVFGSSYTDVSQLSALIRSNKIPEPYKGKGILYENENIILKEGKKI